TVQRSAPVRISDLSARSPSKSCSAPIMIDFPAPVSPVTAINPGPVCHSSSSTSARFLIRNRVRTVGIFGELEGFTVQTCEFEALNASTLKFQRLKTGQALEICTHFCEGKHMSSFTIIDPALIVQNQPVMRGCSKVIHHT